MNIKIAGREIGCNQPPYIIAELSANHNGSLERALATIDAAKQCGADAIKLQTYTADTMTIDCDADDFMIKGGLWDGYKLYDLYKWAGTPYEWHEAMFKHAQAIGMTVFSTPFDESAVDLLESLGTPAYKIASFELTDHPLIRYVAKTGKPVIMSTGMGSRAEIDEAVSVARESGCKEVVLLHCVSSYPAPINQANLRQIPELSSRYNVPVGLSDHTLGTSAAVAAVAIGASIIEKHFVIDHKQKGPDSEFSIDPLGLEDLCRSCREAWSALGKIGFERQESEKNNKRFRRSIYFIRNLEKGETISEKDIRRIRPGFGVAPKYFDELIGKKLKIRVDRGTPVSFDQLETYE